MFGKRYYYEDRSKTPLRLATVLVLLGIGVWWWVTRPNFHVVLPARVYRSAQPTPDQLKEYRDKYHIHKVVNLRGPWQGDKWYDDEHRAGNELGMEVIDINLINHQLPPLDELRHLIHVLDESQEPVLLHCRSGADRTGLASAIARLLAGDSIENAREEYSLWYGHTGLAHGSHLPNLLDLYKNWLVEQKQPHTVDQFKSWINSLDTLHYFSARIRPTNFSGSIPAGQPWDLHLEVTNTSKVTWPGDIQTMQIFCWIVDLQTDEKVKFNIDLPSKAIAPGETVETIVPIPPIALPKRYLLEVDVCDGNGIKFRVMGPFSWKEELEVTPVAVAKHDSK